MSKARQVADGTKYVDVSGDTMTGELAVNTSNNSTSTIVGQRISNTSFTTDSRTGILFRNADNWGTAIWSRRTGGYHGELHLGTKPNSSGSINEDGIISRLMIDELGRVTKPYQPSFRIAMNGSPTLTFAATILWDLVMHNIGGHYSSATGRFTVPVSGRYYVSHGIRFNANGCTYTQSTLAVNGVNAAGGAYMNSTVTGSTYSTPSWNGILNLTAGDYLTVSGAWSGGNGACSGTESWFTGCLIS